MVRWLLIAASALSIALAGVAPAAADTVTPVAGTSLLVGAACPTAALCLATGQAGIQQTGVVVATNEKSGGVQSVSGTNELYGVACATEMSCFSVGVGSEASNGQLVSITGGLAGPAAIVGSTEFLRGIACPTSTFCVAVGWAEYKGPPGNGRIGVVVPIVNGHAGGVEQIEGTPGLEGVACPTTSLCLAVGDANGPGTGAVVVPITNGTAGGAVTDPAAAQLNAIACPSAASCFAVGSGAGAASTPVVVPVGADGKPSGAEPVPGTANGALAGIACTGGESCWAAGWGSTGIVTLISGGVVYPASAEPGTFQLYGVACPSAGPCVAVGDTASVGSGVVVSIGGVSGPWKARDRAAALADLVPALETAARYCTPTALGLVGFGTGALMGGPGAALQIASQITTIVAGPFCLASVKRVLNDYHRAVKDPPVSEVGQLANPLPTGPVVVPSCRRRHGGLRKFCNQLRRAEQKWAAAANTVASVDGALDTTRTREAEALAADQQAAATLQDEHIPSLQKLESAALAAQASAGKAVARILAGRHIRYRLTKSQASKTIAGLEQTLAKQGVSISELKTIAGAALRPRRTDLLRALSRR